MIGNKLKLSVVTPNLNGGRYLEQTIKSVIHQDYDNIEYIIIDGGSNDNSHSIIKKYLNHIKHFEIRKDKNMYEAINYGFKLSTGDIFSLLNSDDLYHRNCLSPILKHMNRKNYNWVNCRSSTMKDEKVTSFPIPFYFPQKYIANGKCHKSDYGFIPQESVFFSRELYFSCGEISTNFKLAGDYFLWKKMSKQAKLIPVNFKCGIFRKRKGQLSGDITKYYKDINKNYSYKINLYRFFLSSLYFIFFGHKF